jgi:hypothetical protein
MGRMSLRTVFALFRLKVIFNVKYKPYVKFLFCLKDKRDLRTVLALFTLKVTFNVKYEPFVKFL